MTVLASVEAILDGDVPLYAVKISAPMFEINVRIPPPDIVKLRTVRATPWESGSLRIGTSGGASAFWSSQDGTLSILVGDDDQTWDIAISVPVETIDKILQEIDLLKPGCDMR